MNYISIVICIVYIYCRKSIVEFGLDNVKFDTSSVTDQLSKDYFTEVFQVFKSSLEKLCIPNCVPYDNTPIITISTNSPFDYIKLTTNESYNLKITTEGMWLFILNNLIKLKS